MLVPKLALQVPETSYPGIGHKKVPRLDAIPRVSAQKSAAFVNRLEGFYLGITAKSWLM
jgi:hypothetical protein